MQLYAKYRHRQKKLLEVKDGAEVDTKLTFGNHTLYLYGNKRITTHKPSVTYNIELMQRRRYLFPVVPNHLCLL